MRNYDLDFLKKFSLVIVILTVITLGLILLARHLQGVLPQEVSDQAARQQLARIAPAGAVYAGSKGAAQQAAAAAAAATKAASQVAYGGTTDGAVIFQNLCTGCHTSGVGNAPTMVRGQWSARIAQGTDLLYRHAIEGYTGPGGGVMPPKGGNPALSDAQVKASVDWMLENLK